MLFLDIFSLIGPLSLMWPIVGKTSSLAAPSPINSESPTLVVQIAWTEITVSQHSWASGGITDLHSPLLHFCYCFGNILRVDTPE